MKILIIEDENEIIKLLKPKLEAECYIVDHAEDGDSGSFLARTNHYDLMIIDYILPKKDGKRVVEEIRTDEIQTPIIILTVKAGLNDKVDFFELGVDDFLAKPFSYLELSARIKAILRRPKNMLYNTVKIHDLEINTKKQTVKRLNKEIYLTRKEYLLFEYLIKNQGKVLSRGEILENVWDMNADPFSNTIEAHIFNLRKKIDTGHKIKLIHTSPGRGYLIDCKK